MFCRKPKKSSFQLPTCKCTSISFNVIFPDTTSSSICSVSNCIYVNCSMIIKKINVSIIHLCFVLTINSHFGLQVSSAPWASFLDCFTAANTIPSSCCGSGQLCQKLRTQSCLHGWKFCPIQYLCQMRGDISNDF